MRAHTQAMFEEIAVEAITAAGCVPCESLEEFKQGLRVVVSMIKERIKELELATPPPTP